MAQHQNTPNIPIVAGANLAQALLVKANGTLCALDTTPDWIGVTDDSAASGAVVPVRLAAAGTVKLTASEAIVVGDRLYKAASGKVSKTATGSVAVGRALSAATGDGSIFEAVIGAAL